MSEVYDFRWSAPGDSVVVETEKGSHILTKGIEAPALKGWTLAGATGKVAVELFVMDPPFYVDSAVVRNGHELAVKALEGEDTEIHSFGEDPIISRNTQKAAEVAA